MFIRLDFLLVIQVRQGYVEFISFSRLLPSWWAACLAFVRIKGDYCSRCVSKLPHNKVDMVCLFY